jgi:hypothetical protein
LEEGEYQLQFKKYSTSFDVFDFTVKVYSTVEVKFEDEDESQTQKITLTEEQLKKLPNLGSGWPKEKTAVNATLPDDKSPRIKDPEQPKPDVPSTDKILGN